jgi:hypothetical protein
MAEIFIGGEEFLQFGTIGFSDILSPSIHPGAIDAPLT